jgi:DedD protein
MAWFNFGKKDSAAAMQDAPVETVETLRTRAKRRLIGALVLVLAAVVGFPLLFDTQPRPLLTNVPIEIPDKNKVKPLPPPQPTASKPVATTPAAGNRVDAPTLPVTPAAPPATAKVDDKASLSGKEEIVSGSTGKKEEKKQEKPSTVGTNTTPSATKTVVNTPTADKTATDKAAAEKAAAEKAAAQKAAADKAKAEATKAQALLDGKATPAATSAPATSAATEGRFIVQFGSFADNAKAREARLKVEKAGFKTYVQVAETAQGKLIRVRVGPYATKAEAEKAAAKIKTLDLPAAILTL